MRSRRCSLKPSIRESRWSPSRHQSDGRIAAIRAIPFRILTVEELAYILTNSQSKVLITS